MIKMTNNFTIVQRIFFVQIQQIIQIDAKRYANQNVNQQSYNYFYFITPSQPKLIFRKSIYQRYFSNSNFQIKLIKFNYYQISKMKIISLTFLLFFITINYSQNTFCTLENEDGKCIKCIDQYTFKNQICVKSIKKPLSNATHIFLNTTKPKTNITKNSTQKNHSVIQTNITKTKTQTAKIIHHSDTKLIPQQKKQALNPKNLNHIPVKNLPIQIKTKVTQDSSKTDINSNIKEQNDKKSKIIKINTENPNNQKKNPIVHNIPKIISISNIKQSTDQKITHHTPNKKVKKQCNDPYCLSSNDDGICTECFPRFYLEKSVCTMVDPACEDYDQTTGICNKCLDSYKINGKKCQQVQIYKNSKDLIISSNIAVKNVINHIGKCLSFDKKNSKNCVKCQAQYILYQNKCQFKIMNPEFDKNCKIGVENKCINCYPGFFPKDGICKQANPQCKKYDDIGGCTQCYPGYSLQNNDCINELMNLSPSQEIQALEVNDISLNNEVTNNPVSQIVAPQVIAPIQTTIIIEKPISSIKPIPSQTIFSLKKIQNPSQLKKLQQDSLSKTVKSNTSAPVKNDAKTNKASLTKQVNDLKNSNVVTKQPNSKLITQVPQLETDSISHKQANIEESSILSFDN